MNHIIESRQECSEPHTIKLRALHEVKRQWRHPEEFITISLRNINVFIPKNSLDVCEHIFFHISPSSVTNSLDTLVLLYIWLSLFFYRPIKKGSWVLWEWGEKRGNRGGEGTVVIKCNSSEHLLSLIALQLLLIVSGKGRYKAEGEVVVLLTDWLSLHSVLLSFFTLSVLFLQVKRDSESEGLGT